MKVSQAKLADHEELLKLTRLPELKHVRDFSNKFLTGPEAYEKNRIWVTRTSVRITGFVVLNHRVTRKDYTSITFIGTHPAFRGKGIAKALVAKALRLSPWNVLQAHVAVNNPEAIEWYKRTGWLQIGTGAWKKGPYVTMEKKA